MSIIIPNELCHSIQLIFVEEIVRKMTLILDGVSGGARSEYLEWKEASKTRKGTKSII